VLNNYAKMFSLAEPLDYEPTPEQSIAAIAARRGLQPAEVALDVMLEQGGKGLLYVPFLNYADDCLEPSLEMMRHPDTILGLGDGGAHVGMICDGSFPTFMLTHWTRDRTRGVRRLRLDDEGQRQPLPARALGLHDRGLVAVGYKADLNLIDHAALSLTAPKMVSDLPAGGKRLLQYAHGYVATIVSGEVVYEHGEATGALPGKLVRGAQPRVA
jgi:N-acyl-D-aspartate/D-glutamate deacylase